MKGIVFTTLSQFVENNLGIEAWEDALDKVNPKSKGAYTAGGTYTDTELMSLVKTICEMQKLNIADVVESFGCFMFPVLAKKYPVFFEKVDNLKSFLLSIHGVIHIEVAKLYSDAELPHFSYEDPAEDRLIMNYRSPRKLCWLAVGLIKGAAQHFKNDIAVKQLKCLHQGSDHCKIEIQFL